MMSFWKMMFCRFKWHHLSERLVHEKITRQHRLRQEVAQAKRQTNFFSQNIEKSKMLERIRTKKTKEGADFAPLKTFEISQRLTDAEIRQQKGEQSRKAATFSKDSSTGSGIQSVLANLFPRRWIFLMLKNRRKGSFLMFSRQMEFLTKPGAFLFRTLSCSWFSLSAVWKQSAGTTEFFHHITRLFATTKKRKKGLLFILLWQMELSSQWCFSLF